MSRRTYVLVTAAYNEAALIENAIRSVLSQTVPPAEWIVVSDGSDDGTDEIVGRAAGDAPFLRLVRIDAPHSRSFAAQVEAINTGVAALASRDYEFIGNLDADVSFGGDYFEKLLGRFDANPRLGLAGGTIRELDGGVLRAVRGERLGSVPHAVQMFRRACYQAAGPYRALRFGGPDTYAEVRARMAGWEVEAFPDLVVQHHRFTSSAGGVLRGRLRQGAMDYSLGYDPLFEIFKCARRIGERPAVLGALARLAAFWWSYAAVRQREAPREFVEFLRAEQRDRLRRYFVSARESRAL